MSDGENVGTGAEQASLLQKRHKDAGGHEDGSPEAITQVLSVMAHTRLLPEAAWDLSRALHRTVRPLVHLNLGTSDWFCSPAHLLPTAARVFGSKTVVNLGLYGDFKVDPLLAIAGRLVTSAANSDATDDFNVFFRNIKVMTLSKPAAALARIPRSLQELHLDSCDPNIVDNLLLMLANTAPPALQFDAPPLAVTRPPEHISGPALTSLSVSNCYGIARIPDSISELTTLTSLSFVRCGIISLPETIGELTALTALSVKSCGQLRALPDSISGLTRLTALSLHECRELRHLPDGIGDLTALTTLHLSRCFALGAIPETIGGLCALTTLNLQKCYSLTCLPDSLGSLAALAALKLSSCEFRHLPDSIGDLSTLTALDLSLCSQLEALPDIIGQLAALTELDIAACSYLQRLPASVAALSQLQSLGMSGLSADRLLPRFRCLATLTSLDVQRIDTGKFPEKCVQEMAALRTLDLRYWQAAALPEAVCELQGLTHLDLSNSPALAALPQSFGRLHRLTALNLSGCPALTSLPGDMGRLRALTQLTLSECRALVSLPESIGNMATLTALDMRGCRALVALPESIGGLAALTALDLRGCRALTLLPQRIVELTALRRVDLRDECGVKGVPATFVHAPGTGYWERIYAAYATVARKRS
eukprot:TRINITY_DN11458_c0_g1_i1.p1 TRINITY_DN11458_c0_g1~~TRINITY_DN11458_c0_g1_i1.p1  ORF type:complete len:652 (-),score=138.77 TRINITY_DN11458_c0_g1_i1:146-2101(-)